MLIYQIIINHAPYRGVAGTGYKGNDLNGVLSVKYIINAVASADLDWIYLIQVKVFCCLFYMVL